MRERRRILQATAVAATVSGAPSTLDAWRRDRSIRAVAMYVRDTTRAVGTLVPPGRPGFVRGAIVHFAISVVCGETLARTLPEDDSLAWGAGAGLAIGIFNVGLIGRRFPAIRALPIVPQLADNLAFGAIFALVADR